MTELHALVCMKVVPKPEEIRVDFETHLLDRSHARSEINPPDMNALEMALGLKDQIGGEVSILSMGPPYFEPCLRVGLAMGADNVYLLSDPDFGGADTLATTYTLAMGIQKIGGIDLVFCGEESSDGATGQVPSGLAEWLDLPQLTLLASIKLDMQSRTARGRRIVKGGYEILEVPMPCVVSVKTASNEPRFLDYRVKSWAFEQGPVTVWSASDLGADESHIGLTGSPTIVSKLAEAPSRKRLQKFLGADPEELAEKLAHIIQEAL
ncbi:MAG: electron transfer flavoprotein subunit beta/FixA family protein [Anaerolineales bacterium]